MRGTQAALKQGSLGTQGIVCGLNKLLHPCMLQFLSVSPLQ